MTAFILILFVISFSIFSIEGRVNEDNMMTLQDANYAVNGMVNRTHKFIRETFNKKREIISELYNEIEIAIQKSKEQIRIDNSNFQMLRVSSKPQCVTFVKDQNFLDILNLLDKEIVSCKAKVKDYLFDSIDISINRIQANITNYKNAINECVIDSSNFLFATCFNRISFNYQAKINGDEIKILTLIDRARAEKSSTAVTVKTCAGLASDKAHQELKKIIDDIEKCVYKYTIYRIMYEEPYDIV